MNSRIFSGGKVFTRRMSCISTVQYYLRKIRKDGKFSLSVTFINLIYLTD